MNNNKKKKQIIMSQRNKLVGYISLLVEPKRNISVFRPSVSLVEKKNRDTSMIRVNNSWCFVDHPI